VCKRGSGSSAHTSRTSHAPLCRRWAWRGCGVRCEGNCGDPVCCGEEGQGTWVDWEGARTCDPGPSFPLPTATRQCEVAIGDMATQ
jgi:hypothetical protein